MVFILCQIFSNKLSKCVVISCFFVAMLIVRILNHSSRIHLLLKSWPLAYGYMTRILELEVLIETLYIAIFKITTLAR